MIKPEYIHLLSKAEQELLATAVRRSLQQTHQQLQQAIDELDPERIAKSAHKLASAAGNGGYSTITTIAKEVEQFAKQGQLERITALYATLNHQLSTLEIDSAEASER